MLPLSVSSWATKMRLGIEHAVGIHLMQLGSPSTILEMRWRPKLQVSELPMTPL